MCIRDSLSCLLQAAFSLPYAVWLPSFSFLHATFSLPTVAADSVEVGQHNAEVRMQLQDRYRYLLVDEWQVRIDPSLSSPRLSGSSLS
eukprot:3700451-Rhodomonas_salina.3